MAHFINCTSCGKQYNKDAFEECPFCGFTPNSKTVICPNRLCGKEVSDKFDHCPFCHTRLIKPKDIINEYHRKKEEELKDAIRKKYNIVEGNGVDYLDIFVVDNDEFEESLHIGSQFYMYGSNIQIEQCEVKESNMPSIHIGYKTDKDGGSFHIYLDMLDLLQEIKNRYDELKDDEISSCFVSRCKGMIINIDDTETIKISHNENEMYYFVLDKEQFLKCCNAKKLEFKIFHQQGDPIVVSGTKEEDEVLIDTFQALYNFVVDRTMFPNAGIKSQEWRNKQKQEIQALESETEMLKREMEKKKQRQKNKKTIGIVLSLFSAVLIIIGLLFIMDDYNNVTICLSFEFMGLVLLSIGLALRFSTIKPEEWGDVYITQDFGDLTHPKITYKL